MSDYTVTGLRGLPELRIGDDLAALLAEAARRCAGGLRDGDVVCVAGKGHETTQEIDGQFHPFDDRLVVQEFLRRRNG